MLKIDQADILRLAAEAQLDPRTVKRAFKRGVDTMKTEIDRIRLRDAAVRLKIKIK